MRSLRNLLFLRDPDAARGVWVTPVTPVGHIQPSVDFQSGLRGGRVLIEVVDRVEVEFSSLEY